MRRSKPLSVGDVAPDVSIRSPQGQTPLVSPGRVTLVWFFRGRWCPFCNNYLAQIGEVAEQVRALATVRVVCCEAIDVLASHATAVGSAFPLNSDPDFAAIDAFGVRHVGAGPGGRDTSLPAYFVVDRRARVAWAYVGTSPTDRPSIEELLGILSRVAATPR